MRCQGTIRRYDPEVYTANVLEPIPFDGSKFDSIAMTYLLHCLPGTIQTKSTAIEHLKPLGNPNAVLLGATLLSGGVDRNWLARTVMDRNNAHGIFSNADDDLEGLYDVLSAHLDNASIRVVGCVAIFSGTIMTTAP